MKYKHLSSEDAVSPVIGVMLMVVITVVIAAVIAVFATGVLGDDSGTTPVIMIDLGKISLSGSGSDSYLKSVEFIHKGGDTVPLDYLEVSLIGSNQRITNYFPGEWGILSISGQSGPEVIAEAGDSIKLTIDLSGGPTNSANGKYTFGETVEWTMYDTRTNGIIASGNFVVP